MGLLTEGIGIAPGQAIQPEHILRSINALSGVTSNDIVIKGSFTTDNITSIGTGIFGENINILKNLIITGSLYGNGYILENGVINIPNGIFNCVNVQNIGITGSVTLKGLNQDQNYSSFVAIDPSTGILGYATGSLLQKETFDRNFKFNTDVRKAECSTTFKDKIYNLSILNSAEIKGIIILSRVNNPTLSWTEHKDLQSLEQWIDKNWDEKDPLYWVKFIAIYGDFNSGEAEAILTYSKK